MVEMRRGSYALPYCRRCSANKNVIEDKVIKFTGGNSSHAGLSAMPVNPM